MYIPGRRRTGSRPSRTVMSFAVYAASAIKKALQNALLRAARSVSETTAGAASREARPRGSAAGVLERSLDLTPDALHQAASTSPRATRSVCAGVAGYASGDVVVT